MKHRDTFFLLLECIYQKKYSIIKMLCLDPVKQYKFFIIFTVEGTYIDA